MYAPGPSTPYRWDTRFLDLAHLVASWSKDLSTKVGAVLVAPDDKRILSVGYNGFPRGIRDTASRLVDRPTKHLFTVHAEANAIAAATRAGVSLYGATAYVTHPCCAQCAALLVQAGVREVVVPSNVRLTGDWEASLAAADAIFMEAGISVRGVRWPAVSPDALEAWR